MFTEYLEEIKATKTKNTYASYSQALGRFKEGNEQEIIALIGNKRIADSTKALSLNILLTALRWYGKDTDRIKRLVKGYRANETIQPCPSVEEVEKMWNTIVGVREKAIFALMVYNGLRLSEIVALNSSHYHRQNQTIKICNTKGKKDAIVPLVHPRVIESLSEYIEMRKKMKTKESALFLNVRGKRLSSSFIQQSIKRICTKVGCEVFHPHSFRRFFANTLSKSGVSLQELKECMRHRSIVTTIKYLNISSDDIKRTLQKVYDC